MMPYVPALMRDERGDDWIQKALYIALVVAAAAGVVAALGAALANQFQAVVGLLGG